MNEDETQPFRITATDRAVGLLILLTLILVSSMIYLRFQNQGAGDTDINYFTTLKYSYGIARGSDITLSGIPIGKVSSIDLMKDGQVKIMFSFDNDYQQFLTEGSYLQITTALGISSLIGGASLQFVPNPEATGLIKPGSQIETLESTELTEAFSGLEINKMAANVKIILQNLKEVSNVFHKNQDQIAASIQNINQMTDHLMKVIEVIPEVSIAAEEGFAKWGKAGESIRQIVDDSRADIVDITQNTRKAADQLPAITQQIQLSSEELPGVIKEVRELVHHLDTLTISMGDSAARLPGILGDGHRLIKSADDLTGRLQHHWLFGGTQKSVPIQFPLSQPELKTPSP